MESLANDHHDQTPDARSARDAVHSAQVRMAARLRSAWWVHALRGVLIGITVFGLADRPAWAAFLVPLGVIGFGFLARWRARAVGFSSANTERWTFLRLGAPWSIVAVVVSIAGMTLMVLDRTLSDAQVVGAALLVAVVVALLGPLADTAARRRIAESPMGALS